MHTTQESASLPDLAKDDTSRHGARSSEPVRCLGQTYAMRDSSSRSRSKLSGTYSRTTRPSTQFSNAQTGIRAWFNCMDTGCTSR